MSNLDQLRDAQCLGDHSKYSRNVIILHKRVNEIRSFFHFTRRNYDVNHFSTVRWLMLCCSLTKFKVLVTILSKTWLIRLFSPTNVIRKDEYINIPRQGHKHSVHIKWCHFSYCYKWWELQTGNIESKWTFHSQLPIATG